MSSTLTPSSIPPAPGSSPAFREEDTTDLLRSPRPIRTPVEPIAGVVIGQLAGLTEMGHPLVDFPANSTRQPIVARTTWPCQRTDLGKPVALLFEQGDPTRPVIVGPIIEPQAPAASSHSPQAPAPDAAATDSATDQCIRIERNGQELVLTAPEQITLRCGKSSITLTKAGKLLLRGAYLLSRSSGVNRIKGGSVQIN